MMFFYNLFKLACLCAVVALALVVGLMVLANAQPQHDHATIGVAGEFYSQWNIPPKRESSCCNLQDCYVTTILQVDGKWMYLSRHTKKYEPLNPKVLEEQQTDALDSPDGQSHVCELTGQDEMGMVSTWTNVICAVRGMGQ